jgi:hypothetical protein
MVFPSNCFFNILNFDRILRTRSIFVVTQAHSWASASRKQTPASASIISVRYRTKKMRDCVGLVQYRIVSFFFIPVWTDRMPDSPAFIHTLTHMHTPPHIHTPRLHTHTHTDADTDQRHVHGHGYEHAAIYIDMDMQNGHGHAAWTWKCSMDMEVQHGHGYAE